MANSHMIKLPELRMKRSRILDTEFIEHRAKLLDIAAFLDRLDRAEADIGDDFRIRAFRDAISVLLAREGNRVQKVLELFSDSTPDLLDSAKGMKGAFGAWPGYQGNKI